jgi:hypothetical protein
MKNIFLKAIALLLLGAAGVVGPAKAQQRPEPPLTNSAIVKLVRAGFKDKTVIAIIRSRPNRFDLDPDRLIELKKQGVSENIILTMLSLDDSFSGDEWGDEAFFKGSDGRMSNGNGNQQDGGTNIFGSSGGSNTQTRSRGANGSNSGEVTTTGSATVRILRPPAEAGDGPAKLERTPTLNNESIVQLVTAGFSEGTIIKRIQDSPAEFDLSPAKLIDLRKQRVSEAIIAAMTAAMDDSDGPATRSKN